MPDTPATRQERGKQFNRTLIISAIIAAIGATLIVTLLYGCMRAANPKLPRQPSTGILLFVSQSSRPLNYSAATP